MGSVAIVREWKKDVPAAWETALRAMSPYSRVVPWLAIRWFPMRKHVDGLIQDCGRWLLSECVPEEVIPEIQKDIVLLLSGPKPSTMSARDRLVVSQLVNDYQWEMYKAHKVWARELWVVQGDNGGHPTQYAQEERDILRAKGLPSDPPAVGDLCYAPVDNRVLHAMQRRNRLIAFGNNLDALRRSGTADATNADWALGQKEFRRQYVQFLEEQSLGRADLTAWVSAKSENRGLLPQATAGEINAAARVKDEYIDTGRLPSEVA